MNGQFPIEGEGQGGFSGPHLVGQRVLVTGAGSFVGAELIKRLLGCGASVVATYRRHSPRVRGLPSTAGLELLQGDLTDPGTLAGAQGPVDAVVHVAVTGPDSDVRADAMFNDNVVSTERCLDFARLRGSRRFILLSSVSLHGAVSESSLSATTGVDGPSMYGLTKRAAEIVLESHATTMDSVALRLPAVLGPGASTHWLSRVVRHAIAGDDIDYRNPEALFNNAVHRSDLVDFITQLLESSLPRFQAFPIASSQPITVSGVVDCVVVEIGSRSRTRVVERSGPCFTIDDSLARTHFGYRSMTTEDAVRRYAREEADNAPYR